MVLTALIGMGIGAAGGIAAGNHLFAKTLTPPDLYKYELVADDDDAVPTPDASGVGNNVAGKPRDLLSYVPSWAKNPDHDRVLWLNHILETVWPYYNNAVGKMVVEQATPIIADNVKRYGFGILEAVDIEVIDLGTRPFSVGGVKTYTTSAEEAILECQAAWGSDMRVRVAARVRLGPWALYLPLEVSGIQMRAPMRITLAPLVETLPCVGAATVTLLEPPYLDLSLCLINRLDLCQLPGIKDAIYFAVNKVVGDLVVYPNRMSFDVMPNGGQPPLPVGMLHIKIISVSNIKGNEHLISKAEPYVEVSVRAGRSLKTENGSGKSPVYNESFNFIVDDPETQGITLMLRDEDHGLDKKIGVAIVPLAGADFIAHPRTPVEVYVPLLKPEAHNALMKIARVGVKGVGAMGKGVGTVGLGAAKGVGTVGKGAVGIVGKGMAGLGRTIMPRSKVKGAGADGAAEVPVDAEADKDNDELIEDAEEEADAEQLGTEKGGKATKVKKPRLVVGTARMEVQYVPFKATAETRKYMNKRVTRRGGSSRIRDDVKGILTITVSKASNLVTPNGGDVDPFVELSLYDPSKKAAEVQFTSAMTNEPNPKWGEKFDFVMCAATSVLTVNVVDKLGFMEGRLSLKGLTGRKETHQKIGTLRLPVANVVRNVRIHDSWALQETQQGDITLGLDWLPIELDVAEDDFEVVAELASTKAHVEAKSMPRKTV